MTAISSLILIFLFLYFIVPPLMYPKIHQGVRVQGVDLSGRSLEEAKLLLAAWQQERQHKTMTLYFDEKIYQLEATKIDIDMDSDDVIAAAWNYGREGAWWERITKIRAAAKHPYDISLAIKYNEVKLSQRIAEWQKAIERPAHNATVSMITGNVIPEQQGYRLEVATLRQLIVQFFSQVGEGQIPLPVTILSPKVTAADLASMGLHEVVSIYTTTFNREDVNRVANIKLATRKANGHILYPGEIFSFNDIVGPREKSYGFKEAMEIVDGEFVPGVGGGICQLSSTLYNAVILANLEIVERHNHSKALSYVPFGRDATVVFDGLDFKFINNKSEPVMIMAEINGNQLLVGILGEHPLLEKIEIVTINQEEIPPAIIKEADNGLYLGETKLEKNGKPGIALTIMRVVRGKGQRITEEILSKDCYPPEDTLIKVGTKIPPATDQIK